MGRVKLVLAIVGVILILWVVGKATDPMQDIHNQVSCSAESADPDACGYFQEQEWNP